LPPDDDQPQQPLTDLESNLEAMSVRWVDAILIRTNKRENGNEKSNVTIIYIR
jgi:hypothetical protein